MTDHIRQIDAAIVAHDEWKARLVAAIEAGSSQFVPEEVRLDTFCAFGQWFSSVGPDLAASPHHGRVRELHALFHKAAADVLTLAISGKGTEAQKNLEFGSEYVKASVRLVDELERWRADLSSAHS